MADELVVTDLSETFSHWASINTKHIDGKTKDNPEEHLNSPQYF